MYVQTCILLGHKCMHINLTWCIVLTELVVDLPRMSTSREALNSLCFSLCKCRRSFEWYGNWTLHKVHEYNWLSPVGRYQICTYQQAQPDCSLTEWNEMVKLLTVHSAGPWKRCAELRNMSRRLTTTLRAVTNELIERAPAIGRDVLKRTSRELEEKAKDGNYQQCRRLVSL